MSDWKFQRDAMQAFRFVRCALDPQTGVAELVYAFEARDGKGEALACGGLDQASVTKAVLDIMEGTEEAFRRRREKYHF